MAKRKLKRALKKIKQQMAGSRQKKKRRASSLVNLRCLIGEQGKVVEIRLIRSLIGRLPVQRRTAQALGLGKISSCVVRELTPSVIGMVKTIIHLIDVKEVV